MSVECINHNGKKVVFTDYTGAKSQEEMLKILAESMTVIKDMPGKVCGLADVTGVATGPDFMKEAKEQGKLTLHKIDKSAIIGVTGLKGLLLKGYNLFSGDTMESFDTKEEALDYLTS